MDFIKGPGLIFVGAGAGLFVGYLVGLGIGKETNAALSKSVTTDVEGGVITVSVDTGNAIKQGVANYFMD